MLVLRYIDKRSYLVSIVQLHERTWAKSTIGIEGGETIYADRWGTSGKEMKKHERRREAEREIIRESERVKEKKTKYRNPNGIDSTTPLSTTTKNR